MPGTAVTKSVVANEPRGKKREEIFVDIIERISVTFSSSVSTSLSHALLIIFFSPQYLKMLSNFVFFLLEIILLNLLL